MNLTIFFLCAGFGSRLDPLTRRVPKPLIPFLGESALKRNWQKVLALKPAKIICNSHHLPEAIRKEAEGLGIEVYHEDSILGTGGCLIPVSHILEETEFFLVHNGDILHSIDLREFVSKGYEQHRRSKGTILGTLSGIDVPAINSLALQQDTVPNTLLLQGIHGYENYCAPINSTKRTYSGIALYHKQFLHYVKKYADSTRISEFDIKPIWQQVLTNHAIATVDHSEASWFDFGTPQGLWEAYKWVMKEEYKAPHSYVSNETPWEGLSSKSAHVVILEKPSDTISENNSEKIHSSKYQPLTLNHCILGKDFKWDIQ
jgi:NDP-sugar pyrophosphorylase family protein